MSIIGDGIVLGTGGDTASIVVTAPTGSTVTCTTPSGIVLTATEVSGTWTFARLKVYGTYTITATKGTDTKTKNVLIDSAAKYTIDIVYSLYLYKDGDKCTGITGGWNPYTYRPSDVTYRGNKPTVTIKTSSIKLSQDNVFEQWGSFFAENRIDLTGYSSLKIHVIRSASKCDNPGWGGAYIRIGVSDTKADSFTTISDGVISAASTSCLVKTDFTVTCNVSSLTGTKYVLIWIAGLTRSGECNVEFDKIWLE